MELTKQLELLKQLCEIDGVSGGEEKVADWLKNHLPEDCKVRTDALGNLICEKKGKQTPKNKLLFSAHMDEVGFIITYIEESGLLRFSSMGGHRHPCGSRQTGPSGKRRTGCCRSKTDSSAKCFRPRNGAQL